MTSTLEKKAWSCVVLQLGIVGSCCWTVGKKHGDNIYIIKLWQILLNMLKINLISAIFTTFRVIWDKKFSSNITIRVVASIWIGIRNMSLPGEPTLWQPLKSDTIYVLALLHNEVHWRKFHEELMEMLAERTWICSNTEFGRIIPSSFRETGSWISVPGSSESQASHSSEIFLTSKSSIDLHFLSYGAQLMLLDS